MSVVKRMRSILWDCRWPLLFLAAILIAVSLRLPRLDEGHVDEVHTIGRSLNMIYTGDFSPKFYHYPSGGLYLTLGAEMMALASISRDRRPRFGQHALGEAAKRNAQPDSRIPLPHHPVRTL